MSEWKFGDVLRRRSETVGEYVTSKAILRRRVMFIANTDARLSFSAVSLTDDWLSRPTVERNWSTVVWELADGE